MSCHHQTNEENLLDTPVIRPEVLSGVSHFLSSCSYKECIESSSSYNTSVVGERKTRLPYLDSQTGVAQSDCFLWMSCTDRRPGDSTGQVYSYPAKKWKKKRRQYLMNDSYLSKRIRDQIQMNQREQHHREQRELQQQGHSMNDMNGSSFDAEGALSTFPSSQGDNPKDNSNNNSKDISRDTRSATDDTSNDKFGSYDNSRDTWYGDYFDEGSDVPDAGELDDPESDYDEEEYGSRKKKKSRKDHVTPAKRKRIEYSDAEKPYACELCGARYKTRPGLSYHYSHSHQNEGGGGGMAGVGTGGSMGSNGGGLDEDVSNYNSTRVVPSVSQPNSSPMMHPFGPGGPPGYPQGIPNFHPNHSSNHSNVAVTKGSPNANGNSAPPPPSSTSSNPSNSNCNDFGGNRPPGKGSVHTPQNYCDFCLGDSEENKKTNSAEILVSCSDCGRSAHPSCLQFTTNMIESVKKYRWQCIECKSCGLCGTSDNDVSNLCLESIILILIVLFLMSFRTNFSFVMTVIEVITCTVSNLLCLNPLKDPGPATFALLSTISSHILMHKLYYHLFLLHKRRRLWHHYFHHHLNLSPFHLQKRVNHLHHH